MSISSEEALNILNKDFIKNVNLINLIESREFSSIIGCDHSLLIRRRNPLKTIYIYSNNEKELRELLESVKGDDKRYAAIENWMLPIISENRYPVRLTHTYKVYLPNHISLSQPKLKSRLLMEKDAEIINENWEFSDKDSVDYIKRRIKTGISAGIDRHLKLVAWCLTHDDGSLGFLYVLEGYRKKGFATNLTLCIANTIRRMGKMPFAYIVEDNYRSFNLVERLGFIRDRRLSWISF